MPFMYQLFGPLTGFLILLVATRIVDEISSISIGTEGTEMFPKVCLDRFRQPASGT